MLAGERELLTLDREEPEYRGNLPSRFKRKLISDFARSEIT